MGQSDKDPLNLGPPLDVLLIEMTDFSTALRVFFSRNANLEEYLGKIIKAHMGWTVVKHFIPDDVGLTYTIRHPGHRSGDVKKALEVSLKETFRLNVGID